jgi:hypothetical protein
LNGDYNGIEDLWWKQPIDCCNRYRP